MVTVPPRDFGRYKFDCNLQTGWVKQIAAGGDLCICVTDKNTTGFIATLHEFAASERKFHSKLDNLATMLIKPLLSPGRFFQNVYVYGSVQFKHYFLSVQFPIQFTDIFKTFESTIHGPVIKTMLENFLTLSDTVSCYKSFYCLKLTPGG